MSAATTATTPRVFAAADQSAPATTVSAAGSVRAPAGGCCANAAGTCCRKMMVAMPRVNPSITGQGMNVTARPSPVTPAASTNRPATTVTSAMLPSPCCATIGASTTAIAPVGPDTCTCEPPNTAATRPATTAVISPAGL